jgi:DNA-binding MarR family transcriptional regulator
MSSDETPWYDDMVMPVLLDLARRRYGSAIREAMAEAGFTDIPKRGARILGGIARNGTIRQEDLPNAIGATKQTASQLVDTLVTRGYLERAADPDDRRRMIISLTERGADAASVSREAVDRVDEALEGSIGPDGVSQLRRVLGEFVDLEIAQPA